MHKDLHDPPRRPIIPGNGSTSEGISQIIDQHLRPHVTDLPSYTRNTIHLLQILDNLVVPDSAILVSFFFLLGEVSSMYTHHILMWQRYIDDILIIWDGPEWELKDCLNLMNQNSFNLFFYDDT